MRAVRCAIFSRANLSRAVLPAVLLLAAALLLPSCHEAAPSRFVTVDVYADTADRPLGAWQLDLHAARARIIGVEGGEGVFAEPPTYDPAALHGGGRIILAAFSTAPDLPAGRVRIARLHLQVEGEVALTERVAGRLAAGPGGAAFDIDIRFVIREGEGK